MVRTHFKHSETPKKSQLSYKHGAAHDALERKKASSTGYTIGGRKIKVTAVFDTFWQFAAERKAIYDRRCGGAKAP